MPITARGKRICSRPDRHVRHAAGRHSTLRPARCIALHTSAGSRRRKLSASQSTISSVSAGFTLLEAIVALTIFSAGALTLYGLFNTNLVALQRVRDVTAHLPAAHRAVTHLSAINPRHRPEGRIEFDGYAVVWSARLLEPVRQGQNAAGRMGHYEIGLYRIDFTLSEYGRPVGRYRLRLIGSEKVRESHSFLEESGPAPF